MLRVVEHFADSDVGRQRQGNEDSFFVRSPLFVVADGMGGAQAGEVASRMAVGAFAEDLAGVPPLEAMARTVREANRRIHERSLSDRRTAGMGTTLTAACLTDGDDIAIAHVGDSRCYLLRDGDLIRLTRDHSLVGELVARGKLTEEQAETHPQRSVITRALGSEPDIEVDVDSYAARAGDVFMVCSDGLTSMVSESRIKELLAEPGDLEARGRTLIAAANHAGGRDNITVILFRLGEIDGSGPSPTARAAAAPTGAAAGATTAMPAVARAAADDTASLEAIPAERAVTTDRPAGEHSEPTGSPASAPDRRGGASATPKRRRRRWARGFAIFALIIVPLLVPAWLASRIVYFVGVDSERGRTVTIYRGVPYDLPGGIRLYERFYPSGVTIDAVPPSRRETFTDHKLRSRDDAEDLVIALERGELDQ